MSQIVISGEKTTKFEKKFKLCVGTGRLGLALQKEYLDHLKLVQEKIGFAYIRGHGLLHDDVGIYREVEIEGKKQPFYNFTYIDRIFDAFLAHNIRPLVEIGFMPKALASGTQTIFYWEGNVTPPKDYKQWETLIKVTVRHFIERYGLEEVKQWPFEIWNEPNLVNFWKNADRAEYFKLYQVTAEAIKAVHPELKVGGPAICGGSDHWITDFLHFCERENVPVDFVSRHAYTSAKPHKTTFEYYYQKLEQPEDMLHQFRSVRELINQSPFPDLPFYITEYNTSYSPVNPVHDTPLNAVYLARILSEAGDSVDLFSYWTFSDVFEEADIPKAIFHGGFGLVALHGIPKPTFHLFSFFNQLGETCLYRDDRLIVTKRDDGSIALVAWNVVMEEGDGFEQQINLKLAIDAKEVFIKRQTVDEQHANPWRVWQQMGRPRFPKPAQVDTLKEAAIPLLRTEKREGLQGWLLLSFTLTKNEVTFIEVMPVKDETPTYAGLDDRLIISEHN
ncbi:xylan 1,4-beta-xylosidase [Caldalkalibacillus uzonensis]|uniref:Xylan 1,4-beta-xylosidase n=1 Tax=Caldalkalibacillus uzonensis TaxID=353224 RepID=A0ABU0CQ98_9BACI|nr:xylan 1,4-beta-xylosidase [Caldalkalibacillus uzonensis]MDQ0338589.1 xylan 1,4-beta-xylosidase [Caldalkalibacillus uzonensis]